MWLLLSVFVYWQYNIGDNDDAICKDTSPVYCCLVDNSTSG